MIYRSGILLCAWAPFCVVCLGPVCSDGAEGDAAEGVACGGVDE